MAKPNATEIAKKLSNERNTDFLLICGGIESKLAEDICAMLDNRKDKNKHLSFILTTEGGEPDAAFRIARSIQRYYEKSTAIIPSWCKSAGTLVCIGANCLQMGRHGELGPLDIQLAKPDEVGGRLSGLTIDSAFRSLQTASYSLFERFMFDIIEKSGGRITTKTAAEIASGMTTGLMSPIFQQIDPHKIGEDYRSTRIAEEYAVRLDLKSKNLRSGQGGGNFEAVEILVRGYASHGFVIDREEAESLFCNVDPIDAPTIELVDSLGSLAKVPRSRSRNEEPIALYLNVEDPPKQPTKGENGKAPAKSTGNSTKTKAARKR